MAPDVLYVQVGRVSRSAVLESRWPEAVPKARAYVATWRADEPSAPDPALARRLATAYREMRSAVQLAGLQLDVDCPTRSLAAYGEFLEVLRGELGTGERLSITALLDWFVPGTRVRDVLAPVDEYVPQFYDTRRGGPSAAIAAPIDAARWAPVFNGLGQPYRIGIATFGRVQRVRANSAREIFRDVGLFDLAAAGLRPVETLVNGPRERLVVYDVRTTLGPELRPGDRLEAVVPTAESVRMASIAARAFGGRCVGVVFFRWPARGETLVMTPDEIARALAGRTPATAPRIIAGEGSCAARSCADLSLELQDRFLRQPLSLRIEASAAVDYHMPGASVVALRQTGPREFALTLPPGPVVRTVALGRFFSRRMARYRIAR